MSYLIFQEGDHCLCFERIFLSDESFNNVPGSNMIFYTSVIQVYEYLYCISLFWINIYSMDNFSRNIINFNQYLSLSVLINFCKRLLNFEIKKKRKHFLINLYTVVNIVIKHHTFFQNMTSPRSTRDGRPRIMLNK